MSKAVGAPKKLASLIKKLRTTNLAEAIGEDGSGIFQSAPASLGDPIVSELVYSLLLGDSTTGAARTAMKRLCESVVDGNELRVWMAPEIAASIGERYPGASERALRIKAALWEIHRRQHAVTLEHLRTLPAREARAYLDSIEGVTRYASARVALGCLSIPCVPLDARLAGLLAREGVLDADAPLAEAGAWLSRNIEPADAAILHRHFQAWSDDEGGTVKTRERSPEPATRRRSAQPGARPAKARTATARGTKAASSSKPTKSKG